METNEALRKTVLHEAEAEIITLLKRVDELNEGDLRGVEHEVLTSMFALGRRVLERVIQEQVNIKEVPSRRQGSCGHPQRLVDKRSKQILTLLGPITLHRAYYCCLLPTPDVQQEEQTTCSHGEAPTDALWGIGKRRTSAGVQEQISYLCASLTLEEAAAAFRRLYPLSMSARQALYLMQPVGEALAEREQQQVETLWEQAVEKHTSSESPSEPPVEPIERLYIELDGVFTRLRRGSVPMEAQERERKGDVYREIKAGAVFEAKPGRERSELVEGVFIDTPVEGSLRYLAHRTALGDFGRHLYTVAVEQGVLRAKQVVVLADGAPWIWRLVEEHFPGAVQIVDLYHAKEHIWNVAVAVFGHGHPNAVGWATRACDWLVHGKIDRLVQAIAALPPIAPPVGQSKSVPEQAMGYFATNAHRMQYPAFRAQGMQIGSGIAEATCKTVVSTRTKRSGMRWTPQGLDALLPLRISVLNGSFDAFWQERAHALV
ncbi:MAG TPA: ISKra4 family transposase [Ktedonobacteraceae bacterium]|nr:ISKra4 family transposase [Ktedonobacteraceae bacterium]